MDDLLVVHVGDPLEDLLHEADAGPLGQHKLFLDNSVKQLSPSDAARN